MKLHLLLTFALFSLSTLAQNGKVKGRVIDEETKEPLAFATISIDGSSQGVNTAIDGDYELTLKTGNHILVYQYLGYNTIKKSITITDGKTEVINISLQSDSVELEGVTVQATRSKERESALLIEQHRSAEIKQHIGSQELSRKGVSDVAAAVAKTSGVTRQEGTGTIFVRGLGDRYNSSYLNGLPLSSDDPEKKNINLGIFNTDIVEYISIDKTYSARNYGDFAGGNIDIISKKYKGDSFFDVSISSNVNTNAVKQDDFRVLSGRSYMGFSNTSIPKNPLTSYNFKNSTETKNRSPYGMGLGFNTGKSIYFGESALNLFATASFSNGFKYKEGISRTAQAQNLFTKDLELQTFEYNTNTTAMLNADYEINSNNSIKYNFLFINESQEKNDEYKGYMVDITPDEKLSHTLVNRQQYKQNRLFVNQLLGNHGLTEKIDLKWGATYNNVSAQTPDRQQYMLNQGIGKDTYSFAINARTNNNRYFEDLTEKEYAGVLAVDYKFNENADNTHNGKLTLGYNIRKKDRDFKATQFVYAINNTYNKDINPNQLDLFFNQSNFEKGYFDIYTFRGGPEVDNALLPQIYEGDLMINAGFANLEYKISERFSAVIGARFESISQKVTWQTQLDNEKTSDKLTKNAFLPSLQLKYELTDQHNLRFAASKTYTLPQFKERARFIYEDVTEVKIGNPDIYASDDYNFDLKWEYYPTNGELFSVTGFGKYIKNPINEIVMASASNDITYANTGDYGYAIGAEIEIKKDLINFDDININKISGGLNAAIMKTYQKLDNEKVNKENRYINTLFTEKNTGFTGASDFLLNADITYQKEWGEKNLLATVSYAHFSDKLQSIGTEQSGNLVDKAFGMLDFTFKIKFTKNFGMGMNAKNLLDPKIERKQENPTKDLLVQSYKLGRNFSLSFNYSF